MNENDPLEVFGMKIRRTMRACFIDADAEVVAEWAIALNRNHKNIDIVCQALEECIDKGLQRYQVLKWVGDRCTELEHVAKRDAEKNSRHSEPKRIESDEKPVPWMDSKTQAQRDELFLLGIEKKIDWANRLEVPPEECLNYDEKLTARSKGLIK